VGTFGYRNEYQISTYSPVGTPGIEMNITYLHILLWEPQGIEMYIKYLLILLWEPSGIEMNIEYLQILL
jgi:hypothetical protein